MSRTYTLRRRAELQAQTRQKIVEAAVALHGSVGPARTTLSMIAERAGVQRHTLYAHFPDERSLLLACSGLAMERDPLPSMEALREVQDVRRRLRDGLAALYGWYGRNADLVGCVVRDAEIHALTREVSALRSGPTMAANTAILGAGLDPSQRACLAVALSYHTWRTLVCQEGLTADNAVELMAGAILCCGQTAPLDGVDHEVRAKA